MMHHDGAEHHIKCLIGEGDLLNSPHLELNGHVAPNRFFAGTGDLLCPRVNACNTTLTVQETCHLYCKCSRTAAHIQHCISGMNAGQGGGPLPEMTHLTTEHEGIDEPFQEARSASPQMR